MEGLERLVLGRELEVVLDPRANLTNVVERDALQRVGLGRRLAVHELGHL